MKRDKAKVMNDLKEFIDDIPVELHLNSERTKKFATFLNEILGFLACDEEIIKKLTEENVRLQTDYNELYEVTTEEIKEKADKIFALENRLKECENGYEGTLYLERCKLHDAEEKNKELTSENERIGIENFNLICKLSRIKEDTVREFAERLKQYIDVGHYRPPTEICFSELDVANIIDKIEKEMLEGAK